MKHDVPLFLPKSHKVCLPLSLRSHHLHPTNSHQALPKAGEQDSVTAQRNQKPKLQLFFKSNVSFISVLVNGSHRVSAV